MCACVLNGVTNTIENEQSADAVFFVQFVLVQSVFSSRSPLLLITATHTEEKDVKDMGR